VQVTRNQDIGKKNRRQKAEDGRQMWREYRMMKERRGKTVIRLTGNQGAGYQESGYQEELVNW